MEDVDEPQHLPFGQAGQKRRGRAKFTSKEDQQLKSLVEQFGMNAWDIISQKMGTRSPRQCHDRWKAYLSPDICTKPWTEEEDRKLLELYSSIGPHWVKMSLFFPNRSDACIKNHWNNIKKKIQQVAGSQQQVLMTPVVYFIPIQPCGQNVREKFARPAPNRAIHAEKTVIIKTDEQKEQENSMFLDQTKFEPLEYLNL